MFAPISRAHWTLYLTLDNFPKRVSRSINHLSGTNRCIKPYRVASPQLLNMTKDLDNASDNALVDLLSDPPREFTLQSLNLPSPDVNAGGNDVWVRWLKVEREEFELKVESGLSKINYRSYQYIVPMEEKLEGLRPRDIVFTTKKDALAVVGKLRELYDEIAEDVGSQFRQAVAGHFSRCNHLSALYNQLVIDACDALTGKLDIEQYKYGECFETELYTVRRKKAQFDARLKADITSVSCGYNIMLNGFRMELIKQAHLIFKEAGNETLQRWFERCAFRRLKRIPQREPVKMMGGSGDIPAEIAATILSFCDLETAVSLRQASPFWYNTFWSSAAILEPMMKARQPWMRLEGYLQSWQDCVLVFVARLASKHRKIVRDFDSLTETSKPYIFDRLPVSELRQGQEMPSNFIDLECGPAAETWKEVSSSSSDETVISVRDMLITLPAGVLPNAYNNYYGPGVTVQDHAIVVCANNSADYVFPRDKRKKLHHKNALVKNGDTCRLPNLCCWSPGDETRLYDPNSNDYVRYGSVVEVHFRPAAYYQGYLWITPWGPPNRKDHAKLVPTFVDLLDPENMYYMQDKIVELTDEQTDDPFVQSASEPRFVSREVYEQYDGSQVMELVDLATGSVFNVGREFGRPDDRVRHFFGQVDEEVYAAYQFTKRY